MRIGDALHLCKTMSVRDPYAKLRRMTDARKDQLIANKGPSVQNVISQSVLIKKITRPQDEIPIDIRIRKS